MEENKSKKSVGVPLILVIFILVIALVACIGYIMKNNEKEIAINNDNSEKTINELKDEINTLKNEIATKNENQYEKIKGSYEYVTVNYPGYEGIEIWYGLNLKEDGTFDYVIATGICGGFCGNYIINGSDLILNKLFSYGTDTSLTVISGQVKLKINDDGTISDLNKHEESPMSSVVLNKEKTETEDNTLKNHIEMAAKEDAIDVYTEN